MVAELEDDSGYLKCPECGGPLRQRRGPDGSTTEACARCKWIWLPAPEGILPPASMSTFSALHCPRCGERLTRNVYPLDRVTVDLCPICRSVWVRQPELAAWKRIVATHAPKKPGKPPPLPEPADAPSAAERSGPRIDLITIGLIVLLVLLLGIPYLRRGESPRSEPAAARREPREVPPDSIRPRRVESAAEKKEAEEVADLSSHDVPRETPAPQSTASPR